MRYHSRGEPPQSFRTLKSSPSQDDLNPYKRRYLRQIVAYGEYPDKDTYLDINYRLLREDIFGPFREIIQNLKTTGESAGTERIGLRVYEDVVISGYDILWSRVAYKVQFNASKLGLVDWSNCKTLKKGSLLCLSRDDFRSCYFATVANSNSNDLSKGRLSIFFVSNDAPEPDHRTFKMVESPAYFEAYKHVLNRLQEISDMPLQDYIVKCKPKTTLPEYLRTSQMYNYDMKRALGIKSLHGSCFSILDKSKWPKEEDAELNRSQLEAIMYALTNKLALIQGPPGTGKTFTALRVALALLDNKDVWCKDRSSPILVVSQTNHALDQFLEGLHEEGCKGLVRVGGRSKSAILEQYRVYNIIESRHDDFFRDIKKQKATLRKRRDVIRMEIEKLLKVSKVAEDEGLALRAEVRIKVKMYKQCCKAIERLNLMLKKEVIKGATVVGMTTSGAAKHHDLLAAANPKIVIIEEAAEVLEAHVVTSLVPDTEHLLLFGDHKQLRPKPNCTHLSAKYNLQLSMFERLIMNKIPYKTLTVQHRMRPEAALLLENIYPKLQNHPSVLNFENIRGVSSNVFFVNHTEPEEKSYNTASHSNVFEAKFLVALCKYLLGQGYQSSQITILATYSKQVSLLEELISIENDCKVRVSSVDGFQGEENDIILLSLVRSNQAESIGFLSVENRVCVMLSRAKKGLFVVGNMDQLANKASLWRKIVTQLKKSGRIGRGMPLQCPTHSLKLSVDSPDGFQSPQRLGCESRCPHLCCRYKEYTDYKIVLAKSRNLAIH